MTNTKALNLLAQGYKEEFIEVLASHEKFIEAVQEIASEFVEEKLGEVLEQELQLDMAFLIFDSVKLGTY